MKLSTTKELIKQQQGHIEARKNDLMKLVPKGVDAERIICVINNAISKNPALAECTPVSLLRAASTACEYGIEPNTPVGLGFIIPYNNSVKINGEWKKQKEAAFQLGYKGLVELAYRSPRVQSVYAEPVYQNDVFEITKGLHRDLIHKPTTGEKGPRTGCYGVITLKDADPIFHYMSADEIESHARRYSQAYQGDLQYKKDKSPWSQPLESATRIAMELKTVVVQAATFAPKSLISTDFARAVSQTESLDYTPGLSDIIDTTATETDHETTEPETPLADLKPGKAYERKKKADPQPDPDHAPPSPEEIDADFTVTDESPSENIDHASSDPDAQPPWEEKPKDEPVVDDPGARKQLVVDINKEYKALESDNKITGKKFKELCGGKKMVEMGNAELLEVLTKMKGIA